MIIDALKRITRKLLYLLIITVRYYKYRILSTNKFTGTLKSKYPVLLRGKGKIKFDKDVNFGLIASPFFFNSYGYAEARSLDSEIIIGNNVSLNNNFSLIAEKGKIIISNNVLAGFNLNIVTSDFHNLDSQKRLSDDYIGKDVFIGQNVFIGNNVTILKGVNIGENSVIGNNSLVTKNIPPNSIAGGNPAKVIRNLQ